MATKRTYDLPGHAHFVTFSCYKRRRYLDRPRARQIVIGMLARHLPRWEGVCFGFVVMPEHAHALLWFAAEGRLARFMNVWKGGSSGRIKQDTRRHRQGYAVSVGDDDSVWQRRYYDFNITSEAKCREKLIYMHNNPVARGLVEEPGDWPHSSARWYEEGRSVGVALGTWEEVP
jgi:putative transposase